MEDNYMEKNEKNYDCILPAVEIMVNFQTNGYSNFRDKRACYLHTEKMHTKNLVQLRLTEKLDQRRMYITTVDADSFATIKRDQSLHVTFEGFIDNLIKMLQDCLENSLHLHLVQTQCTPINARNENTSFEEYQLQFVETRVFRNIVHLVLPCQLAAFNVVLFYMSSALETMHKKMAIYEQQGQQLEDQNKIQKNQIDQLTTKMKHMQDNHTESICKIKEIHANEIKQLKDDLRKCGQLRQDDNDRFHKNIATLQEKLNQNEEEKSYLKSDRLQEQKRIEMLNEELSLAKSNGSITRDHYEKVNLELATLKIKDRKSELQLHEARKQITDLQDKLKKYEKVKADLKADLEAERNISQTKRKTLEYATEEISKANQIIITQSQELHKLKKTVGWRTEVALQQEVAVKEKEKLLQIYEEEMKALRNIVTELRDEVPKELDSLRKYSQTLEENYACQIKELKAKYLSTEKEFQGRGKSNFSQRNK